MGGRGETKEKLVEWEREGFSFPENSRNFYGMPYGLAVQLTSLEKNSESMGARNRGGRGLSYRPARLYIGWRNSFLGIDSVAPYTFKNTGSECQGSSKCFLCTP